MTLPHVNAGDVARAAQQNALIDTVNDHTVAIDTADGKLSEYGRRLSDLESAPSGGSDAGTYFGQWTDNNGGSGLTITESGTGSPGRTGVKHTDIGVPVGTPVGATMNAGTFTPAHGGKWAFFLATQYEGNNTNVRAVYLAVSTAASGPNGVRYGLIGGPTMDAQSTSAVINLSAEQAVSVYVAVWTNSGSVTVYRGQGNLLTAVWLGP